MKVTFVKSTCVVVLVSSMVSPLAGAQGTQTQPPAAAPAASPGAEPPRVSGVALPAGYVIGSDDVLAIVFWRDKDMSTEVRVRPDGKISVPLLNEVQAAGLTPDQLRDVLEREAKKLLEDPNTTVVVKEINSRKVFVTGQVAKPGSFPLNVPMTVLQAIAEAGGLLEYAQSKNIVVLRNENGKTTRLPFNYKEVVQGKKLETNVQLKPGDTVVVP